MALSPDKPFRFASGLLALGLRPEDRVALLMSDTVDYPVAFFGAIRAGVAPEELSGAAAGNGMRLDGTVDGSSEQSAEVWVGGNFLFGFGQP